MLPRSKAQILRHKQKPQLQEHMQRIADYGFDLDFRPSTYWSEAKAARANVTGTLRRAALDQALRVNDGNAARAALDDQLGSESKEALGAIRPWFRSGEDLRPVSRGEVEIARITLESVHGEVTSIRARLRNGRILYRVDDEGANEFGWKVTLWPRSSKLPLSLRELILSINTACTDCYESPGLVIPHWHTVFGRNYDVGSAASFVRIQSYFYPALAQWYASHLSAYAEERRAATAKEAR